MLSPAARLLTYALAALYAALGAVLFVAPHWAAGNFAWNVSPLVAMTIGGWCLGNAWAAMVVARRWSLALVATGILYLVLFGVLEAGVLLAFSAKLKLGHWLAWLYLAALGVNLAAIAVWIADLLRLKPDIRFHGARFGLAGIVVGLAFTAFVGFLGLYGLFAPSGSRGLGGGIFPEVLTPFTLRAFGAFYLSIALPPLLLVWRRDVEMTLSHMYLSWGFILFITAAALVFIGQFDVAARPGQLIYIGAYLVVGTLTLIAMLRMGTGRQTG